MAEAATAAELHQQRQNLEARRRALEAEAIQLVAQRRATALADDGALAALRELPQELERLRDTAVGRCRQQVEAAAALRGAPATAAMGLAVHELGRVTPGTALGPDEGLLRDRLLTLLNGARAA
jgi:hypothetical protein